MSFFLDYEAAREQAFVDHAAARDRALMMKAQAEARQKEAKSPETNLHYNPNLDIPIGTFNPTFGPAPHVYVSPDSVMPLCLKSDPTDKGGKYRRKIYGTRVAEVEPGGDTGCVIADIYDVLDAFPTGSSALDHAVKKILCAGQRGHKDRLKDLREAAWSIDRAIVNEIRRGANDAK